MADDDHVAVIDTSYEVHSTGNGTTLVRCRAGDSESSMRVTVQQRIARVGIVTGVTRTLRMVLDTIHLGLAKVDKRNTPMDVGTPTWRSLDTAVIAVNAAGEAVGRAEGTGRVVAMVNGFADTTELEVIPEQPSFAAVRPALRIGTVPGQRTLRGVPGGGAAIRGIPNVSARPLSTALRARDILVSDSVFQARSMALSGGATSPFRFSVLVVQADHLLDLGAAGGQQERSGLLFGGELDASPAPKITIHLSGEYGPQLNPQGTGYAAEDIAAARGDVGLGIFPWLSLTVGGGFRTYTDAEFGTRQVWESFRGGLEANFDIGGAAHGIIGVTAMPLVSIQNPIAAGNPFGLASVAGLDYSTGKLSLGFRYELERYFFPGDRREQFGALQFRLGFNLGGQ